MIRKSLRAVLRAAVAPIHRLRYVIERHHGRRHAAPGPFPLVVVLDGLNPVVNTGAIIRSADAFGARAVYAIGLDYFDVAPAVGSVRNVPHRFFERFDEVHRLLREEGYTFYALEPRRDLDAPRYIHETELAEKAAFVVGNEKTGISFSPADHPDVEWVSIAQYGVVPCLNAAHAATVAMYEYTRRFGGATRA